MELKWEEHRTYRPTTNLADEFLAIIENKKNTMDYSAAFWWLTNLIRKTYTLDCMSIKTYLLSILIHICMQFCMQYLCVFLRKKISCPLVSCENEINSQSRSKLENLTQKCEISVVDSSVRKKRNRNKQDGKKG